MSYCDTCCHKYSDICGTCESLDGVPVKYMAKAPEGTRPCKYSSPYGGRYVDGFFHCWQDGKAMIEDAQTGHVYLVNIENFCFMIESIPESKEFKAKSQEPIDIQDLISHVGYDKAQCGYDK